MAKTKSVQIQMEKILDTVSERVKGVLETESLNVANETVDRLRAASPKGPNGYAEGWTVSKKKKGDYVVHNAPHYRLTHLLENSHVIRNKKGTYGRTSPGHGQIIHIKPQERWANKEFQKRVEEGISNL